jgi:hypothetical protein
VSDVVALTKSTKAETNAVKKKQISLKAASEAASANVEPVPSEKQKQGGYQPQKTPAQKAVETDGIQISQTEKGCDSGPADIHAAKEVCSFLC